MENARECPHTLAESLASCTSGFHLSRCREWGYSQSPSRNVKFLSIHKKGTLRLLPASKAWIGSPFAPVGSLDRLRHFYISDSELLAVTQDTVTISRPEHDAPPFWTGVEKESTGLPPWVCCGTRTLQTHLGFASQVASHCR
jgi:hypothetical protein